MFLYILPITSPQQAQHVQRRLQREHTANCIGTLHEQPPKLLFVTPQEVNEPTSYGLEKLKML